MEGPASLPALFSLHGQTALVTGGTRGIGQAMTLALAEAGAGTLLIPGNTADTTTKTTVENLGRKAEIYVADLSSAEAVAGLIPTILQEGYNIDILL